MSDKLTFKKKKSIVKEKMSCVILNARCEETKRGTITVHSLSYNNNLLNYIYI